jgi:predicted phosphodiesterase
MRLAIVSDIHGNRSAFDAVLADLRLTAPDIVFHGGDLADGCPGGVEIVDQIRSLGWHGVAGNTDQMLAQPETLEAFAARLPHLSSLWATLRAMAAVTRQQLGPERLAWLGALPLSLIDGLAQAPIALVHATPGDTWSAPGMQASDDELIAHYSPLAQPVVVYGHVHTPFVRKIGGLTVANAGSVGLPYDGDPRASYLLIDDDLIDGGRIDHSHVQIRRVAYDLARELQALRASGSAHAGWIARILEAASPQMP